MIFITRLINYDNYNSFSGCDVVVSAQMAPINDGDAMETHVLGSLQTISYSTHQDRAPVRSIGNINAIDYVQGQRTVAGTMVFAMFHEHWMIPLLEELSHYVSNTDIWSDELPALNLTISMANEYGYESCMVIYGVKFIDDGGVMSINDLYTENTLQYVATGIQPLRSTGRYQHSYKTSPNGIGKITSNKFKHKNYWNGVNTYLKEWSPKFRQVTVDDIKFTPKAYAFYLNATLEPPIKTHEVKVDGSVTKRKTYDFVVKIGTNDRYKHANYGDGSGGNGSGDNRYEHEITNIFLVDTDTGFKHNTYKDSIHNIWAVEVPEGVYDVTIQDKYGNVFDKVWSINVSEDNNQSNVQVNKETANNYDIGNAYTENDLYNNFALNTKKDCPVISEVGDTSIKILSNATHDYVSTIKIKEGNLNNSFEDTLTDEISTYKISTSISIGQSNNKEILIENLKPDTKYLVYTHNSVTGEKSDDIPIKTFPNQRYTSDLLKEYIRVNSNLLADKDIVDYDFDSIKYEYNNIVDSLLDMEDNNERTEVLFYAVKLQNELNNLFNDNGIRSDIFFNNSITNKFVIGENIKTVSIFKKIRTKSYYANKINYVYAYQYIGKPNIHYFLQPTLINNKKSSRIDFVCFSEDQQDFLHKYNDEDKLSNLSFLNDSYTYDKYNKKLQLAIKAANNLIQYKEILDTPYAKVYNDTLVADVNYLEKSTTGSSYLCIATPEDAVSYAPIRKIEFTTETTLQVDKYKTGILKNNYYLLWIQDSNFNNISPAFILSTYNNDIDIYDYYYNKSKDYLQGIADLFPSDSTYKQYLDNAIITLLSENDIRYKDINYSILQTMLTLYDDHLITTSLDDIMFAVVNTCFNINEVDNVKTILSNNIISFDSADGFNMYISCITITQTDIIKNKLNTFYDINSYDDGYTLLFLTDISYGHTTGYILINNKTKKIYTSNIKLEVIKHGR